MATASTPLPEELQPTHPVDEAKLPDTPALSQGQQEGKSETENTSKIENTPKIENTSKLDGVEDNVMVASGATAVLTTLGRPSAHGVSSKCPNQIESSEICPGFWYSKPYQTPHRPHPPPRVC
jgi:hypothetical protein